MVDENQCAIFTATFGSANKGLTKVGRPKIHCGVWSFSEISLFFFWGGVVVVVAAAAAAAVVVVVFTENGSIYIHRMSV